MLVASDWLLVAGYLLIKTRNKQPETSNKFTPPTFPTSSPTADNNFPPS